MGLQIGVSLYYLTIPRYSSALKNHKLESHVTYMCVAGLGPDARVWWRIASVTALGLSEYSEPLQLRTDAAGATSPAQPEPPGVAAVGSDSAAVAWPAVGDGADGGAQILEYLLRQTFLLILSPFRSRNICPGAGTS